MSQSTYCTYFDLRLRPDPEVPAWDRLGRVLRIVHVAGANTGTPSGTPFAIAFPDYMLEGFSLGQRLRVFTQDTQGAEALYDGIEQAPMAADLAEGSRVRRAPQGVAEFEAYRMHRIPSGTSKGGAIAPEVKRELQAQARLRRLEQQQQQGLPFLRMRSSTGHGFRLVIERIRADPAQQGKPNGYGLSRQTQIVALPVLD